ncbi:MAG: hypothetical protein ABI036_04345 [Fibrobacteria bacterium]
MSIRTIPYSAPEGAGKSAQTRIPAAMLGAVAGVGLLLSLPGQARADGFTYGHAEITLGFPNGQVTVGKTWDDDPRQVIVEEAPYAEEVVVHDHVIVEPRYCPPPVEEVTIINRYQEPVRCDREVRVVRQVYVDPPCRRPDVVVYRRPERVIYAPSRTVIVAPRYNGGHHEGYRGDYRGYGRGDFHGDGHGENHAYRGGNGGNRDNHGGGHDGGESHGYRGGSQGPPNLFPQDQGRPARARGVQHFAQR